LATFKQLQDRVYYQVRDPDGVFVTPTAVKAWLNDAQLDLASRLRPLTKTTTGTLSTTTLALPSDFLGLRTLRFGDDDIEVVDDEVFNDAVDAGAVLDHTMARITEGKFEFYPTPAVGTAYELRYYRKPTTLVADADVSELPEELHVKMVYWALFQAMLQVGEEGRADRWLALYEKDLPPASIGLRLWPGPLSVEPAMGPFDKVPDSVHV
jgi:hypothetical protein